MNQQNSTGVRGRRRQKFLACLFASVIVAGTAIAAAPAQAYVTTGCKYASPNIGYRVLSSVTGTYVSTSNAAASAWSTSTDVNMSASSTSNLRIDQRNDGASGFDGYSTWACTFGLNSSSTSWYNTYSMNAKSTTQKQGVMVHEIGHVLGLNHSPSNANIMFECAACTQRSTPNTDDRNGINALY